MEDLIGYPKLIDDALRGAIKEVFKTISHQGLPGEHHLYVTFRTSYPGVFIADHLKEKYPEEMTIVLQHQFWNMKVEEKFFSVVLSFNKIREKLVVPYQAITAFVDPSVKFGLQLQHGTVSGNDSVSANQLELPEVEESHGAPAKIISLDSFRKNKP